MTTAIKKTPTLISNTIIAEHDCPWCNAVKGKDVHSAACPYGERYKQVQSLGGVRYEPTFCLECGTPVESYILACDKCLPFEMAVRS